MLEDLLAEIATRGFLLSNLFQLDSGQWQANLRTPTHCADFGRGPTPAAALDAALDRSSEMFPLPEQQTCVRINVDHLPDTGEFDLIGLITKELRKSTPNPFKGRL